MTLFSGIFLTLYPSDEFKLRYADRYYKHFYNGPPPPSLPPSSP